MRKRKHTNRKLILAVPVVWSVMTAMQAAASAADGGADAGQDSGTTEPTTHLCSVAPATGAFGTAFGAGCC